MEVTNSGLADRMESVLGFIIHEEECCLITALRWTIKLESFLVARGAKQQRDSLVYESKGDFQG